MILTASSVILSVLIGLGLAILLDRKFPGRGVVRTLLITPFLVMPMAAALVWKHDHLQPDLRPDQRHPRGRGVTDWISKYPKASVVATIWQWTPFMTLILLAGLQGQPRRPSRPPGSTGPSALATFRELTLPLLRPYMELGILLGSIYLVNTFDAVQL